jgi:hypothetical protein
MELRPTFYPLMHLPLPRPPAADGRTNAFRYTIEGHVGLFEVVPDQDQFQGPFENALHSKLLTALTAGQEDSTYEISFIEHKLQLTSDELCINAENMAEYIDTLQRHDMLPCDRRARLASILPLLHQGHSRRAGITAFLWQMGPPADYFVCSNCMAGAVRFRKIPLSPLSALCAACATYPHSIVHAVFILQACTPSRDISRGATDFWTRSSRSPPLAASSTRSSGQSLCWWHRSLAASGRTASVLSEVHQSHHTSSCRPDTAATGTSSCVCGHCTFPSRRPLSSRCAEGNATLLATWLRRLPQSQPTCFEDWHANCQRALRQNYNPTGRHAV